MEIIQAAGAIVWRAGPRGRTLAVIHRPHRGDWSLPKGKLEEGESFEDAAVREANEETGCEVRLGAFAGASAYESRRGPKVVLYWHMDFVRAGRPRSAEEVDEVRWLTPGEALRRLDRERDRRLLRQALTEQGAGERRRNAGGAQPGRALAGLRARAA